MWRIVPGSARHSAMCPATCVSKLLLPRARTKSALARAEMNSVVISRWLLRYAFSSRFQARQPAASAGASTTLASMNGQRERAIDTAG